MNTRQLHHFLALLSEGSLTAAAEAVHLSAPALSRSIRSLEESLGVPLFDRTERRLSPTAFAYAFQDRARRIVFEEKEGVRALELMNAGEAGILAFGMGSSLAGPLLKPMVLQLLEKSPQLKLRSVIETTDRLMPSLLAEQLDFFVGDIRMAALHADVAVEPVRRCRMGWYARAGHPLANRNSITIRDLMEFPLIVTGYLEESLGHRFMEIYGLVGTYIDHFAVIVNDLPTLLGLVESSNAVVLTIDFAMLPTAHEDKVELLDVNPVMDIELTLGIVRLKGRTLIPAAERAFDVVRERLGSGETRFRPTSSSL